MSHDRPGFVGRDGEGAARRFMHPHSVSAAGSQPWLMLSLGVPQTTFGMRRRNAFEGLGQAVGEWSVKTCQGSHPSVPSRRWGRRRQVPRAQPQDRWRT